MENNTVHDVKHKMSDSAMWYDLLKVKDFYLQGRYVFTRKGDKTRFWLDPWLYSEPLSLSAPILFELCENKHITVAQAMVSGNLSFRRWLDSELRNSWESI